MGVNKELSKIVGRRMTIGTMKVLLKNILKDEVSITEVDDLLSEEDYRYDFADINLQKYVGSFWVLPTRVLEGNERVYLVTEIILD